MVRLTTKYLSLLILPVLLVSCSATGIVFNNKTKQNIKDNQKSLKKILTGRAREYTKKVQNRLDQFKNINKPAKDTGYHVDYAIVAGDSRPDTRTVFAQTSGYKYESITDHYPLPSGQSGFVVEYSDFTFDAVSANTNSSDTNRMVRTLNQRLKAEKKLAKNRFLGYSKKKTIRIRGNNWSSGPPLFWFKQFYNGMNRADILTPDSLKIKRLGRTQNNHPIILIEKTTRAGVLPNEPMIDKMKRMYTVKPISIRTMIVVLDSVTNTPRRLYHTHVAGFRAKNDKQTIMSRFRLLQHRYVQEGLKRFNKLRPKPSNVTGEPVGTNTEESTASTKKQSDTTPAPNPVINPF